MTTERHQAVRLADAATPHVPWLCVAGAKGGVGKTMIACNLGMLMTRAGYRTLLIDFDPGTGNVAVQLRVQGRHDLDDVAAGRCSVREAIVHGPGRLQVLPGRSGPTDLHEAASSRHEDLFRSLRANTHDFDLVVFDTGAGLGPCTTSVASRCDVTIGVTTPEVTSLTDTYALAKVMHRAGLALPKLAVNRVRSHDEAMRTAGRLDSMTRKFLDRPSELVGWVGDDSVIERSIREQRPLPLLGESRALQDLTSLSAGVLAALPTMRRGLRPTSQEAPRRVRLRPARL